MCVKPANEAGGVGVVKIYDAADLQTYGVSVKLREDALDEFSLSWDNPPIRMPRLEPSHFYVEEFIEADRYTFPPPLLRHSFAPQLLPPPPPHVHKQFA